MEMLFVFALGLIGVYHLIRRIARSRLSQSSVVYITALIFPGLIYAFFHFKQVATGKGDGFAPAVFLSLALGLAVVGLVGLMLNGVAHLHKRAMSEDLHAKRLRTFLRCIAVGILALGLAAAYWIWPHGLSRISTEAQFFFVGMRVLVAAALAGWALYVSSILWR